MTPEGSGMDIDDLRIRIVLATDDKAVVRVEAPMPAAARSFNHQGTPIRAVTPGVGRRADTRLVVAGQHDPLKAVALTGLV